MNRTGILAAVLAAATTLSLAPAAQAQLLGRNPVWRTGVPDCCRGGICDAHRHGRHDRDGRYDRHDRRDGLRALRQAADRLETATDRFARSFDAALDRSRLDGSRRERRLNEHAQHLERAADRFEDRVRDGRVHDRLVDELFDSAGSLDRFLDRARMDRRAERDWAHVEEQLAVIARHFGLRGWRLGDGRHGDRYDRHDRYDRYDRYGDRHGRHDDRYRRHDDCRDDRRRGRR